MNDKLASLGDVVEGTEGRPTAQVIAVDDLLAKGLTAIMASLETALAGLQPLNALLQAAGQPPIVPGTAEP